MANIYATPVMFAKEKNVVFLYARVVFDNNGVPILDTNNSKGICSVNPRSVPFTGATTNSVSTIGTISSFADLFTGMTVTGSAGSLQAATTIGSLSVTGGINITKQAILTGAVNTLFASGGQYVFQFGTQAGVRLDAYNKLLSVQHSWDETTASASGTATQLQLAPATGSGFIVDNSSSIRTIPSTATSGSTDCSITLQFGTGAGLNFNAVNPVAGEVLRIGFTFGNSTGP